MNDGVRHVGNMVEWTCPGCGSVLQGVRFADAHCGSCRNRIHRLHFLLAETERDVEQLTRALHEQCEVSASLRTRAQSGGLTAQARRALELAQQYIADGDDLATSERLRHAVLQAIACVSESEAA